MPNIALKTCPACGGDWFREADYYAFLREESVGSMWPTWPDLVGQNSLAPMTLLVCLCGTPLRPSMEGVHGGRRFNLELVQFLDSLQNSHAWLKDHHDGDSLLAAAQAYLAKTESFEALAGQVKALERLAGRRIAQQPPLRKSPRGRYWALPKRKPASGDVLTLDTLVIALRGIGLTARVAKKAVKAIFDAIINWMKDGGIVETPLGVFEYGRRPPERTLFRLGRERKFNTQLKKVVFRPSREVRDRCNRSVQMEIPVPYVNIQPLQPNQQQCEKCGSTYFVEAQFRQYLPYYSASPGGDIISFSEDPIRALVCLCGNPIPPGRLRRDAPNPGDYKSFRKSFVAALQYRESTNPEAILRRIAEIYANKPQHDELAERIAKLETILKALPRPSPRQPSKL
jgi:nucleoid DNA-binding protein